MLATIPPIYRICGIVLLVFMVLNLTGCDVARTGNDFITIITKLQKQFPAIAKLTSAVAYMIGIAFVIRAIFALKIYGEMRTMMSSHSNLKIPIIYLIVGIALVFSPNTIKVMLQTVYGSENILAYNQTVTKAGIQFTAAFFYFVQIVGFISFVRGWIMLAGLAQQSHQTTFGKALTHIVGGLLAMNIGTTIEILKSSIGG